MSFIMLVIIVIGIMLYFMPTIIAYKRRHKNFTALLALNIFLGWTVVGWVGSLVWSLMK